MAALTQLRAFGAHTGRRNVAFDRDPSPPRAVGKLTQLRALGFAGRRYGSFARTQPNDLNVAPAPLAVGGTVGVSGNIAWTIGLNVVANPLSITGSMVSAAGVQFTIGFDAAAPVEVSTVQGTVGVSGNVQFSTAFNIIQGATSVPVLGVVRTAANVQTTVNLAPAVVALAGMLSVSGDTGVSSGPSTDVGSGSMSLAGVVGVSGDIQSFAQFNLANASLGVAGSVGVAADFEVGTIFNFSPAASLGLTGAAAVAAPLNFETPFSVDSAALALQGALGLAGQVQYSTAVFGRGAVNIQVPADDRTMFVPALRTTMIVR